ncbi:MAG: DNA-processing protein DprA [Alphaproteobacteria bacterium]
MAAIKALSQEQKLQALRLWRSENVGPMTFWGLMRHYGSAENALAALPELAKRGGRKKPLVAISLAEVEKEYRAIEALGAGLVAWCEPEYPDGLRQITDAPPFIVTKGFQHLLRKASIAVVGARNASLNGQKIARQFATGFGEHGFVVTSGLARGIDRAAHEASLDSGTIAVMAGGIDHIYPSENRDLYAQIAERGLIISEWPPGVVPQASFFPRRNRLISGLSVGVVVVEAALQSGSLITARMAAEQGREVFAVPGSPADPRARGSNLLLKEGAQLAETPDDVLQAFQRGYRGDLRETGDEWLNAPMAMQQVEERVDAARAWLLEVLSPTPIAMDEILRQAPFHIGEVMAAILELELAGRIERQPGNKICVLIT